MKQTKLASILIGISFFISSIYARTEVLFSPVDKPTTHLLELIKSANSSIYAAVYMITDKIIADALIEAKEKRDVDVQIITDKISYESAFGKGKLLESKGIKLFIYNDIKEALPKKLSKPRYNAKDWQDTKLFGKGPIMHHKFALFDAKTLWNGSFNWTVSANRCNQENVIITDEAEVCKKFRTCFDRLKTLSIIHGAGKKREASPVKETPPQETLIEKAKAFFRLPTAA